MWFEAHFIFDHGTHEFQSNGFQEFLPFSTEIAAKAEEIRWTPKMLGV